MSKILYKIIMNYYIKETITTLINRLKYLETLECRKLMKEEDRVFERRLVTYQFRQALISQSNKYMQYNINININMCEDPLYN
jgi:hypothetical protein